MFLCLFVQMIFHFHDDFPDDWFFLVPENVVFFFFFSGDFWQFLGLTILGLLGNVLFCLSFLSKS